MRTNLKHCLSVLACLATFAAHGQSTKTQVSGTSTPVAASAGPNLAKEPTLYVVPYAHLDTQWRWDYPRTIREFLPSMRDNFALFEKYPHYVFNFSGANRYRMMKEYYPADYAKIKDYVAAGRWFPAGSSMEESDVNSPSAESIVRQILYGNQFFRHEFGKASAEYMLPDCFGFPASLPSILAHMGLRGFSTQKLSWHSAVRAGGPGSVQDTPEGIPFNVGFWQGLDGKGVIAALNATDYTGQITEDLTRSEEWYRRVQANGRAMGLFTDYRYYGTGDIGGAPREKSVALMEALVTKGTAILPGSKTPVQVGTGPLHVLQTSSEQMFLDIPTDVVAQMPKYTGDLELVEHSAGSLTSEAYMKKWNRANEVLADAAERASVAATWLGGRLYPQERLNRAWTLVMGGQFHDILPGTSLPQAYRYSWNDELLAMNQFAGVLTSATDAVASVLDTNAKGLPIVVYNALSIGREDVVEASLALPNPPKAVRVFGPDGKEVPAQLEGDKVVFVASVPPVGYAVYEVQAADKQVGSATGLSVTKSKLENTRYRITLNDNGDVSHIFDKRLNRELLASPARLAFKTDRPQMYPAWNMDWADQQKSPRAYVNGPPTIRIVEQGPARVALEVSREVEDSRFVQTIRLSAGDGGNRIEVVNAIDWHTAASNLKAEFPLTVSNPLATYNWDIGAIQRGNDDEKKFEVASHQWFDLTDDSGAFGVTVLTGAKNGSDKPNDNTLDLTLLRTPGIRQDSPDSVEFEDQASQDFGHHEFTYGLASHAGDWRPSDTPWQAWRLDSPLIAFHSAKHDGVLGRSFSLVKVSSPKVRILAVKKAEESDEVILRLVELAGGKEPGVHITFAAPVIAAREVNGQEMPLGSARVTDGSLETDLGPYQLRTFALRLAHPASSLTPPKSVPLSLAYERSVSTPDGQPAMGAFDSQARSLPAEMLPQRLEFDGVEFKLAPSAVGKANAILAKGQTIDLPPGNFNAAYILVASAEGDEQVAFTAGADQFRLTVPSWTGFLGQWDDRQWKIVQETPLPAEPDPDDHSDAAHQIHGLRQRARKCGTMVKEELVGVNPGFVKTTPVAWFASHYHASDGTNAPYSYSYLFGLALHLAPGSRTITLPDNGNLRILAITAVDATERVEPAQALYDTLQQQNARELPTRAAK